ncbi:Arginine--tRNA ligase, cytoplasmic [Sphaceloma murrayae]|uniref:arginine--tRNA ligase n=1 Tax=Sphaceloma murrayae TaxID=2082308 RepID=A0A2K1QVV6_9PEZI|nr:Arginine--tRNA ligase, cytoplasmic [Sphaceloma murrayae]
MALNGSPSASAQSIEDLTSTLKSLGLDKLPSVPQATTHPTYNQLDIFRTHIAELLEPITGVPAQTILPAIQWTQTLEHGDFMLPVPALRIKGKKPDALAQEIQEKARWRPHPPLSSFPTSPLLLPPQAEKSFVRFFLSPPALTKLIIPSILASKATYGLNPLLGLRDPSDPTSQRKKMIVEFSSPNMAKPFHAGHLRSTIIGGFLGNLYEGAGWEVVRMNYLGDWGKQYGVLAVGFKEFGDEGRLKENPIGHLYDVYVRINAVGFEEQEKVKGLTEEVKGLKAEGKEEQAKAKEEQIEEVKKGSVDERARQYFKRMVDGDEEAVGTWKRFRDLSIVKYKQTYARLNIRFDDYSGESQVKEKSMAEAAKVLAEKGVSEESEGAVVVDLTKHSKKLGKALVRKKDGTSLYLTRDIGAAKERLDKYHFDKMIYVVASQQDLHLAQLFKILEIMGEPYSEVAKRCQHINFGMVLGMSTRKGTAKFLDDILRDVADKMHDVMRSNEGKYEQVEDPVQTADTLGISAVMVQDMSGKRINNYEFDLNRMTSFEGDTGPYLQYAHARLCSIARKAGTKREDLESADFSLLTEKHAVDVVRSLAQWPDVFINTIKTQEPTTVLVYLFKMTHLLSSSYEVLNVLKAEPEVRKARGALYECARQVLNNGMRLLGLSPVERM